MDMQLIWVERKRKYFCKRGWTRESRKRATDLPVRQNQLACPPRNPESRLHYMSG
jgi:hypothetical protein